jgi:hypothetical protein
MRTTRWNPGRGANSNWCMGHDYYPPLVVFHVQLKWRSWLQDQVSSETYQAPPYFYTGIRTLEQQRNLAWVPSCANVPQLQDLQQLQRPVQADRASSATPAAGG